MSTSLIGATSSNPIPMITNLLDFYSSKTSKTVFVSIGTSSSPIAELEIAETLGCPIHIIEWNNKWNEVKTILTTRKDISNKFTKGVSKKIVSPDDLFISEELPFFYKGSIDLSGTPIKTIDFDTYVESICKSMNISEKRIDLLNIQTGLNLEIPIIFALSHSSYRPGLICINYTKLPDSNIITTQMAGHLHNIGYILIAKETHKFLYRFIDNNVYEFASYENTTVDNPLLYEFIKETLNSR